MGTTATDDVGFMFIYPRPLYYYIILYTYDYNIIYTVVFLYIYFVVGNVSLRRRGNRRETVFNRYNVISRYVYIIAARQVNRANKTCVGSAET
jgi:hypothetical protein